MKNIDVLKAYNVGPDLNDISQYKLPKKRPRRSKLQKQSEYILKLRTEGKSFQFIADRLKKLEINCNRSTVFLFYKKLIEM